MSGNADFARHLTAYLGRHLPGQRNLAENTIASYRDAFRLLIAYFESVGKRAERLSMDDLDRDAVEGFIGWLGRRGCSDSTLSQRLCAIKAFVNYVKGEDPARLLQYQQVLAIRQRKAAPAKMVVPGREGLAAILVLPSITLSPISPIPHTISTNAVSPIPQTVISRFWLRPGCPREGPGEGPSSCRTCP